MPVSITLCSIDGSGHSRHELHASNKAPIWSTTVLILYMCHPCKECTVYAYHKPRLYGTIHSRPKNMGGIEGLMSALDRSSYFEHALLLSGLGPRGLRRAAHGPNSYPLVMSYRKLVSSSVWPGVAQGDVHLSFLVISACPFGHCLYWSSVKSRHQPRRGQAALRLPNPASQHQQNGSVVQMPRVTRYARRP